MTYNVFFAGIRRCASVEDIPALLLSLQPGVFTEYPLHLEARMCKPSTVYNVIGEIKQAYEWLWETFSLSEADAIRLIAKERLLMKTYRKWRKRRATVKIFKYI